MSPRNPYPGLRPFEAHEFESFFGRDRHTDELLLRLRDHRFVAVVGLSGSGKSSLVRAGLIHKLQVGHLTSAGASWKVALFRPGSRPIEALAAALDETLGPQENRAATLRSNTHALRSVREGRGPQENLLLLVDQFEEIFRFQREKELSARDAAHFVDILLAAEQDLSPEYRVYVVITMRSDYLGDCAQFEGLPEALNRCQYLVPRMSGDPARDSIEGPAALTETEIAPELVQRLAVESAEGRDQLPLLQHLLARLWDQREVLPDGGSRIDAAQYAALGGPAQALNDHADRVFEALQSDDRKELARRIFQCITEIGEGRDQRRPARLSRLVEVTGADLAEVKAVVEHFFEASFLTSPDRGREEDWEVDITHESLIRQWTRLREWATEEAVDAKEYREFADRTGRGGTLLSGSDLELARRWLGKRHNVAWAGRYGGDLAATIQFIERSSEAQAKLHAERELESRRQLEAANKEKSRRRANLLAGVLALITICFGALGLYATTKSREASQERQAAQLQASVAVRQSELAESLRADAVALKNRAELEQKEAVLQRREAERGAQEISRGRVVLAWQSLARQAVRDIQSRLIIRPALLGRQAYLFHSQTPEQPKYLIEDALVQWASLVPFPSVALPAKTSLSVSFSSDGTRLASGSDDKILVWDLRQHRVPPLVLEGHERPVQWVVFSPDGTRLASGSDDKTIRLWDLRQLEAAPLVLREHEKAVMSVAFSPDGTRLASGSEDTTIRLWDLRQLEAAPLVLRGHEKSVMSVDFSPDGTRLASGSADKTIRIWDLRRLGTAPSLVLNGHDKGVISVAFSRDGTRLASGSEDTTIRLWDMSQPEASPLVLRGHGGWVNSVAFSPDGKRLASGSHDETIRLWDLRQRTAQPLPLPGVESSFSPTFSPDRSRLASGSADNAIRLWDLRQPQAPPSVLKGHADFVTSLAFSPDGTRLASGSRDQTIRLWDLRRPGGPPLVLRWPEDEVNSVAFSPDGTRLASGTGDSIWLWDLRRPAATPLALKGHSGAVMAVAFSPDGLRLASGSLDQTIRLWDLHRLGAPPLVLKGHTSFVKSVAFSPNGTELASGSNDKTIRLWQIRQPNAPPLVLRGSADAVASIAFSPDGTRLVSGDTTIRLWDLRQPGAPPLNFGKLRDNLSVAFSPDGLRLAAGSSSTSVHLWDLWTRSADRICEFVNRNLSVDEWKLYVGEDIPYQRTCANLPPGIGAPGAK